MSETDVVSFSLTGNEISRIVFCERISDKYSRRYFAICWETP